LPLSVVLVSPGRLSEYNRVFRSPSRWCPAFAQHDAPAVGRRLSGAWRGHRQKLFRPSWCKVVLPGLVACQYRPVMALNSSALIEGLEVIVG
jgi:hypothetical protein